MWSEKCLYTFIHELNFFYLTGVGNLGSWGAEKVWGKWYVPVFSTSVSFHSKMLSGSSCWISAGLCVVTASRVVIHYKLAASWAEKTHSRVGKYTRTPCGRTHPKCVSHPAALRISGVQSLQLQVSHKQRANSMKSLGIPVIIQTNLQKGRNMLSAFCSQCIVRLWEIKLKNHRTAIFWK